MKRSILLVVLAASFSVNAQSLKELLYSGKLKSDTGTVVRKSDDLSKKIDTSKKKPVDIARAKSPTTSGDSSLSVENDKVDTSGAAAVIGPKEFNTASKDNNKIWKEFIDSVTSTLKTEVLPSKKIKSDTYYILIEYEIGADGQIAINNVSCSPENSFLQQQVKERLTLTAPQMNPLLTNGKARKVVKKYTLILPKS